jgi:prepilin-type N-terminal cleavage/methylation domain-containing protein
MQNPKSNQRANGFTLVEMLVVLSIIGLLAALLLPALNGGKQRAKRIVCESQLRQIGIAFQTFAHDHNSKFPMEVSTNDGGSMEFVQNGFLMNGTFYFGYRNFQPLASVLRNPDVLLCPADMTRSAAMNFNVLQNSNISYFVGVNADYNQPMSILAGDGNLAVSSTLVQGGPGGRLTWTRQQHEYKGNVLFSDCHVEEWKDGGDTLASTTVILVPTPSPIGPGPGPISSPPTTTPTSPVASGGSSTGGSGDGTSTSQSRPSAASNPSSPSNNAVAQSTPATSPENSTANPSGADMAGSSPRRNMTMAGGEQIGFVISNSAAGDATVPTNPVIAKVSSPKDTDTPMSPTNRKVAGILRTVLAGSYLLVLLLILLYTAYRIWLSRQKAEQKRRLKSAQTRTL